MATDTDNDPNSGPEKDDNSKKTNSGEKSFNMKDFKVIAEKFQVGDNTTNNFEDKSSGKSSASNINYFNFSAEKTEKEKITNYIYDFKPNAKKLFYCDDTELTEYTTLLNNENILVLDSIDYDILLTGLSSILLLEQFKGKIYKRLNFDRSVSTRRDILFGNIIEEFIEKIENIILVVFTNSSPEATKFIDHFLSNDFKTSVEAHRTKLKERNCLIIIAVGDLQSAEKIDACNITRYVPRYKLPFIKYKLSNYYNATETIILFAAIEKQRREGKWSGNDEEFSKEINRCLQLGAEIFKQNILEKGNGKDDFGYNNLVIQDKEDSQRLVSEDLLIRYIAYVAINFKNITLNEFRYVTQALLDDAEKKEVTANPLKENERVERKLLDRWNSTADIIMRKLQLKEVFSEKDNSKLIVYENIEFADLFKEEFLTTWSWFSHQQFTYLYFKAGLLFCVDTPYRVLERFVKIAAEVAMNDPDLYTEKLLFFTTFSIINQEAKIDFKIDPYEDNLEQAFEDFLSQVKEKHFELKVRQLEAMNKIVLLIEEMLNHDNLRNRINSFLNLLFQNGLDDTVLFFVYCLRANKFFDVLDWIKKLLDRSPSIKTKKDCYSSLLVILSEGTSPHIFQTLDKIQKWFKDKPILSSDSAAVGICVIIDYLFQELHRVKAEDYGAFPMKFHLFANIEDENIIFQKLEMIGIWLLQDELQKAYVTLDSFFERRPEIEFNEVILAYLIIRLQIVLAGGGKTENHHLQDAVAIRFGETFIETIYKQSTKIQKKELKLGFKNWRDYYAQVMRSEQTKKHRDIFQSLSRISGSLLNYFNQQNHTIL